MKLLEEFKEFLKEHKVISLALAFIVFMIAKKLLGEESVKKK